MTQAITIIGGGLAGCEAAWQAAERGVRVTLHEMKPHAYSPAHHMAGLAELVCSNSLRGESLENAVGLLKEELRRAGSQLMAAADATRVPAGGAVAVDGRFFSAFVTGGSRPILSSTLCGRSDGYPPDVSWLLPRALKSDALAEKIRSLTGPNLYFYDAIAPS